MEFVLKVNKADRNWYMCCCCVLLLLFCVIFVFFGLFYDPPTFSNHTSFHEVAPTSYRLSCGFHMLFFALFISFNSRWVVFLFHTMFLSFFASRIRHSFLRDLSMNQSLAFYLYSPRGAKVPFVGTKIPFMGVNKLRMECKKYQSRNGSIKDLPRETYHINSIHSPNVTNSCVRSFSSCLLRPDLHTTEVFFLNIFILIVLNLFKRNRIYNTFTKH